MNSAKLVSLLLLSACSPQSDIDRAIAPVVNEIAEERARQAELPPAADMSERFRRIYALDQGPRQLWMKSDLSHLPPQDQAIANRRMSAAIAEVDAVNLDAVLAELPPEGWFLPSRYGRGVSETAFLVLQHSNAEVWARFVPVLEPLALSGEISGEQFGLMYDRLAQSEGRPQRFGSQLQCRDGLWEAGPLEDADRVDQLRADLGFEDTLAGYKAKFASYPCR